MPDYDSPDGYVAFEDDVPTYDQEARPRSFHVPPFVLWIAGFVCIFLSLATLGGFVAFAAFVLGCIFAARAGLGRPER